MKKNPFINLLIFLFFSEICFSYEAIDTKAPDFTLSNSFGEEISLSEFIGKKVIIEWTNHGCPFVAKHYKTGNMQSIQQFSKEIDAACNASRLIDVSFAIYLFKLNNPYFLSFTIG